jgi:hypothetical protein
MVSVRLLFLCAIVACAQDPFEIVVFEYEPMARGAYSVEAHLNYVPRGTVTATGPVAPTNHQFHFSTEVTAGVTDRFRMAAVLLTAERPDHSLEYAGFRILPHLYAPEGWHLPLNLGIVGEFSFQRDTYEENTRRLEVRGIIERHFGRLELDSNPVFTRVFRGPAKGVGWIFEPAARVAWKASRVITPSVEYYSSWGPVRNLPAIGDQFHQILPGADVHIGERLMWSIGTGIGTTSVGSRVVLKSRIEFSFGHGHS